MTVIEQLISQILKSIIQCCDFIDRILVRFVGERLILAMLIFVFLWVKYGICKLMIKIKTWLSTGFSLFVQPVLKSQSCAKIICLTASIILAICSCVTFKMGIATLPYCAGIFALVGWAITRKFGTFDSDFAAKKFLVYYIVGIFLFYCAECCVPQSRLSLSLQLISLCIFSSTYPFHGWIEHFFMHAPSCLIVTFLLFFRPVVWIFTLQFFRKVSLENYQFLETISKVLGVVGCLFVPTIYLVRCGLRGFGGYVVCCGNGPLWLLFHCFEKVRWGFLLVAQSISYAILIIILVEAQRYWQREDVVDLRSYFRKWRGNITVMAFIVLAVHSISIYTGKGGHYRRDWHPSSLYVAVSFISFIQNFAFFGFVISLFYPSEEEED